MKGIVDIVFLGEIVLQAKIAKRATERLEATHDNFDNIEVWCSVQSILVAAGNVSKVLWPPDKNIKREERDYDKCSKYQMVIFYQIETFGTIFLNIMIVESKNGSANNPRGFILI